MLPDKFVRLIEDYKYIVRLLEKFHRLPKKENSLELLENILTKVDMANLRCSPNKKYIICNLTSIYLYLDKETMGNHGKEIRELLKNV